MSNERLAKFSVIESQSRGRQFQEKYDDARYRSTFGRDRDRIIGSSAFRRLQYKTQVFVNYHGDHYRTRLTHTLEVAQIARWIAGGLLVNKDLAEIVALTHDLGHPPFGHAGEEALNKEMKSFEAKHKENFGANFGFSHNAHSLKIITKIENRFIEFPGLNLSWETIEGTAKHNGPIDVSNPKTSQYFTDFNKEFDLQLEKRSSLEAQVSAIADDIAYNNHDIEDGLRAGLFEIEDLLKLNLVGKIYREILEKHPNISREMLAGEARKRLILKMVIDVIHNTKLNLYKNKIRSEEDVRNCNIQLVDFSPFIQRVIDEIRSFLMKNMYRHNQVNNMTDRAEKMIHNLFWSHANDPKILPEKYHKTLDSLASKKDLAILICDYIAGMTDRFATQLNNKLLGYRNF